MDDTRLLTVAAGQTSLLTESAFPASPPDECGGRLSTITWTLVAIFAAPSWPLLAPTSSLGAADTPVWVAVLFRNVTLPPGAELLLATDGSGGEFVPLRPGVDRRVFAPADASVAVRLTFSRELASAGDDFSLQAECYLTQDTGEVWTGGWRRLRCEQGVG